MKRSVCIFLPAVVCLLLGGCRYSHEITEMAYVVALGVDKSEEGVRVSVQFARPLSIAGEGGEGKTSDDAEENGESGEDVPAKNTNTTVLTVDAEDVYTAFSIAENSLSKQINLSHTKLLLFSAELAKDGLTDYVTLFMKDNQFSPNTYVALSLCPADEYIRTVNPSLEINPAKYYTLIFSQNNSDYTPSTSLRDLYFSLSALDREAVLPATNVSDNSLRMLRSDAAHGDYDAGALPSHGENRTDVSGMAILRGGALTQVLSSRDALSYHILTGQLRQTYLSFPSPSDSGRHITLRLTQSRPPQLAVNRLGDAPQLAVRAPLTAEIVECPAEDMHTLGTDGLNRLASASVTDELENFLLLTSRQGRADVVGFGSLAKLRFADYPAWQAYDWPERYPAASFDVAAQVTITREGLVREPR